MIRLLLLACLLFLCAPRSEAADSRRLWPKTVLIQTHGDEAFGALSLRAEILPPEDSGRISSLSLHWLGREITVPAQAYSDLQRPEAASFTCSVWLKAPDRTELEISFQIYDPRYWRVDRPALVTLTFVDGRLVSRTIKWSTGGRKQRSETKLFKT